MVVFAAVITLIIRKLKDEYILTEIENFKNISWLNSTEQDILPGETQIARPAPPSKEYIEKMRKKRLYEAKMVDVVIEIAAYLLYLFLCLLISYGHRDPDAYAMTHNMEMLFINNKFDQVRETFPEPCQTNEKNIFVEIVCC